MYNSYGDMLFEWDDIKARANFRKHGVTFEQAKLVFSDPLMISIDDPDHSVRERRFVTFGIPAAGPLLAVVHTKRKGAMRIISARKVSRRERRIYEQG